MSIFLFKEEASFILFSVKAFNNIRPVWVRDLFPSVKFKTKSWKFGPCDPLGQGPFLVQIKTKS